MLRGTSLRQRQRQQTREEIVDAAFRLFADQGFATTTVEQIASTAGLSTRTVFRHFQTKEAIVFGDQEATVELLREALGTPSDALPPLTQIRDAILRVQQPQHHADRERLRAKLIEDIPAVRAHGYQLADDLEAVVASWVEEYLRRAGQTDARLNAVIAAGIVFGALRGARKGAAEDQTAHPAAIIDLAFNLAWSGLQSSLPAPEESSESGQR